MTDLYQRSIEIILENQTPSGAYVASPHFPTYHYCWFRDGSFSAYAMDLAGEHQSAARFHDWAARIVLTRAEVIQRAISRAQPNQPPVPEDQLHTRYTLEGEDGTREEWPNYQLDGLGTWLWALNEHLQGASRAVPQAWLKAAQLAGQYLQSLWRTPCYDCWEEFPDDIHPYTLASIYAGLKALSHLDGRERGETLSDLRDFLFQNAVYDGYFVKKVGSYTVDASLLGLAVPYQMVDDPRYQATLQRIEASLVRGGGVHRYPTDTYYGGGEWLLLAGWLGWVYARQGQNEKVAQLAQWMEDNADQDGALPEQVPATLNDPNYYQPWLRRWGPSAHPLLWSHAKYIILRKELEGRRASL
jgi:GH15 family glucan-1,4-alpha-glucosidase